MTARAAAERRARNRASLAGLVAMHAAGAHGAGRLVHACDTDRYLAAMPPDRLHEAARWARRYADACDAHLRARGSMDSAAGDRLRDIARRVMTDDAYAAADSTALIAAVRAAADAADAEARSR